MLRPEHILVDKRYFPKDMREQPELTLKQLFELGDMDRLIKWSSWELFHAAGLEEGNDITEEQLQQVLLVLVSAGAQFKKTTAWQQMDSVPHPGTKALPESMTSPFFPDEDAVQDEDEDEDIEE